MSVPFPQTKTAPLLIISIFFSLFLAEFALRIISPPYSTNITGAIFTPRAQAYGWAGRPNEPYRLMCPDTGEVARFSLNSQGWKDVEHSIEKPAGIAGIVRVLIIGDSHTWGNVPPDELYTRKLEFLLKRAGRHEAEVISMGVGGWGTDQALEALKLEGLKYSPDLVIYQFCDNDIGDILAPDANTRKPSIHWHKPFKYELAGGGLTKVALKPAQIPRRIKTNNLMRKSALAFNLAGLKTRSIKAAHRNLRRNNISWWKNHPIGPFGMYRRSPLNEKGPNEQKGWELFEALVLQMRSVCENNNARFIIFSADGKDGNRNFNLRMGRFKMDGLHDYVIWEGKKYGIDLMRPLKELRQICQRHNIPLIEPKRKYVRHFWDNHCNRTGNLEMAKDIADYLIDDEVWPQAPQPAYAKRCFGDGAETP